MAWTATSSQWDLWLLNLLFFKLNLFSKVHFQLVLAQLGLSQVLLVFEMTSRHIRIQLAHLFDHIFKRLFENASLQTHIHNFSLLIFLSTCLCWTIFGWFFWPFPFNDFLDYFRRCLYHRSRSGIFLVFVSLGLRTFGWTLFGGLSWRIVYFGARLFFFLLFRRQLFNLTLKFLVLFVLLKGFER